MMARGQALAGAGSRTTKKVKIFVPNMYLNLPVEIQLCFYARFKMVSTP